MIAAIERALGLSPQYPRKIKTGVGFAMVNWLEIYLNGLTRSAMVCTDETVKYRVTILEHEARFAHSSLQSLIQQGSGDFRPAVRVLARFIDDQVGVVTSHALNVATWGTEGACEFERHALSEARTGLHILSQIDPQWARKQNEFLEKHGY